MNFLRPEFLYLFFLIPILIAINLFFKGKRTLPVTTLFIWEKFQEEHKSKNFTFNRLRKDIPLLLQILFVILSTIALAQPTFLNINKETDRVVFIIDSSISMNAGVEGKRHIDLAKKKAIQLLSDYHKSNQVLIIKATSDPEIIQHYSSDTNHLINTIRNISTTDTISDLHQAITMAFSLKEAVSKIVVFTDRLPDNIDSSKTDIIKWVSVGNILNNNVKVSNLDLRQDFSINRNFQAFVRISNDSSMEQNFKLRLFHEEELFEESNIVIAPHDSKTSLISLGQIREGLIKANIDINDDLVSDNESFFLLEPDRKLSALLITSGNDFLQNVFTIHDSVDIDICEKSNYEEYINKGNYDIVIYDMVPDKLMNSTNTILICSKENEYIDAEKGVVYPESLNFNYAHKSLKNLDLSNLSINKSYVLNVPDWGETLIESKHGAVMFCGERNNRKLLVIGFDLMHSNFPLEVAFPLFISRIVSWFKDFEHKNRITAGTPFQYTIPDNSSDDSVIVTKPDGSQITPSVANNLITITDTLNAGEYLIKGNTFQKRFVVNFQKGNIADNKVFSKHIFQHKDTTLPETTPRTLGILFAVLSLGALVVEWFFYIRV